MNGKNDGYGRDWIISTAIGILDRYEDGEITLRGLHYQLVGEGMPNTQQHYKRVVAGMTQARWQGLVDFEKFSDHDRGLIGETRFLPTDVDDQINQAKSSIESWMDYYSKNRWENQPYYVEVWIEKKALQGVFGRPCQNNRVALFPCKGYPSLTSLRDAFERFRDAKSLRKKTVIIYFGDYDPSGEDIPRSLQENLLEMGMDVEVDRIALHLDQVRKWKLPPAPAKKTDSRTAKWKGIGQVELDAVKPEKLREMCNEAILKYFDKSRHDDLMSTEEVERRKYRAQLKDWARNEFGGSDDE